jgi:hypothetical protein
MTIQYVLKFDNGTFEIVGSKEEAYLNQAIGKDCSLVQISGYSLNQAERVLSVQNEEAFQALYNGSMELYEKDLKWLTNIGLIEFSNDPDSPCHLPSDLYIQLTSI